MEISMDTTTHHTMQELFAQLGLPNEPGDISAFVRQHWPLADNLRLSDAPFWNDSQASFLREKIRDDDDWAVLVDTLNAQLRDPPTAESLPQAEPDSNEGEGNVSAARRYNAATQQYVRDSDPAAAARAAAPVDAHEAAELQSAEQAGAAKARH
jgi:hypothetical protein